MSVCSKIFAVILVLFLVACGGGSGGSSIAVTDTDGDGIVDANDEFPNNPSESLDSDGDGVGNNADVDDDGDGVDDSADAFPLDPSESVDSDGDGIGNNSDTDDDGDGVADTVDAFPLDPTESVDTDGDGIGDNSDPNPTGQDLTYTVGGTVSGLNGSVVLQNNGGDDLTVSSDGAFSFATALVDTASYSVSVKTQPSGQTCSITGATGTVSAAVVTSVGVSCVSTSATTYTYTQVVVTNPVSTTLTVTTSDMEKSFDVVQSDSSVPKYYTFSSTDYRALSMVDVAIDTDFRASCTVDSVGVSPTSSTTQYIWVTCGWNTEIVTVYEPETQVDSSGGFYLQQSVGVDDSGSIQFHWKNASGLNNFGHISPDGTYSQIESLVQDFDMWDFDLDRKTGAIVASRERYGYLDAWSTETWLNYYAGGMVNELYRDDPTVALDELKTKYEGLEGLPAGSKVYGHPLKINDNKILYTTKIPAGGYEVLLYDASTGATTSTQTDYATSAIMYKNGFFFAREGATYLDTDIYVHDEATQNDSLLISSSSLKNVCTLASGGTGTLQSYLPSQFVKNPESTNKNLLFVLKCDYQELGQDLDVLIHYDETLPDVLAMIASVVGGNPESVWAKERINGDFIYSINDYGLTAYKYRVDYFKNATKWKTSLYSGNSYSVDPPLETTKYVIYESYDVSGNLSIKISDGVDTVDYTIELAGYTGKLSWFDNSENYLVRVNNKKIYRINLDRYFELYKLANGLL